MKAFCIAATLLALTASAVDARTLTDKFDRTVELSDDGSTYTVTDQNDGFSATVRPLFYGDDASALDTINAMAPSYLPPPPRSPVITRTAFLGRFTQAELIAISAAARTDDNINVWLITALSYDRIDLTDPLTKQGLDALVAAKILTTDREATVLTP